MTTAPVDGPLDDRPLDGGTHEEKRHGRKPMYESAMGLESFSIEPDLREAVKRRAAEFGISKAHMYRLGAQLLLTLDEETLKEVIARFSDKFET